MDGVEVTPKAPLDVRLPSPEITPDIAPIRSWLSMREELSTGELDQLKFVRSVFGNEVGFAEILHELADIERKLGAPKLGETRLSKIYRYMRATQNVKQAERIRDSYLA